MAEKTEDAASPVGKPVDEGEIDAAAVAVRTEANSSGYGEFISDAQCRSVAAAVVAAVETYRSGKAI